MDISVAFISKAMFSIPQVTVRVYTQESMNITNHEKSSKKLSDKPCGSWEGLNKQSLSTNNLHQTLQIFEPVQLAPGSPQCSLTIRPKLVLISLKAIFVRLDRRWPEAEIISIWFPP